MLELEFEPPSESDPCECCGGVTTALTRFVLQDGYAFAVVYMSFSNDHEDRVVKAVISAGKWWDGSGPSDRTAFALELRSGSENYEVTACDAHTSPWHGVELIGQMLDREEALVHPLASDVFHITDHLFDEDVVLKTYLDTPAV